MQTTDLLIRDFTSPPFQQAFRLYFQELGIAVQDWDGLFREMNQGEDGGQNLACLRLTEGGEAVGFLQFCMLPLSSWFFDVRLGFVREFWVAQAHRGQGHGSALLRLAEAHFAAQGACGSILTSDTAPDFYLRRGYRLCPGAAAKNQLPVFLKLL